jgi:hypothetical protein
MSLGGLPNGNAFGQHSGAAGPIAMAVILSGALSSNARIGSIGCHES